MRTIDADELKQDLLNKSFYPAIVAAAIERAPTVDPYEWISVEDDLPAIDPHGKGRYKDGEVSIRVLCTCKQYSGKMLVKEGYYEKSSWGDIIWRIPGSIDSVTHWTHLPMPPTEKEN